MKRAREIVSAAALMASVILVAVIFYTMRNEHHETLDALSAQSGALRAQLDALHAQASELQEQASQLRVAVAAIPAAIPKPPPPPALNARAGYAAVAPIGLPIGDADPLTYKTAAVCPQAGPRTMVMMPTGQSNAGNTVAVRSRSRFGAQIVNFYEGRCWIAEDPLLGSNGDAGTVWVPLANQIIEAGLYDDVVIAPVVFGGSGIDRWVAPNDLHLALDRTVSSLAEAGLPATDVMWVHGEAERYPESPYQARGGEAYRSAILDVISTVRSKGNNPRFYVTLASSCPNPAWKMGYTPTIRSAQISVLSAKDRIVLGPDLDAINGWDERYDICHLSAVGAQRFAKEWLEIIAAQSAQR